MKQPAPVATIPGAWLKPLPKGYKFPMWRWIVLPATTIALRKNGGAWVNGKFDLLDDRLQFTQTGLSKNPGRNALTWGVLLTDIHAVSARKGFGCEIIDVSYAGGALKLMGVKSLDFVARLQQAVAAAAKVDPVSEEPPAS